MSYTRTFSEVITVHYSGTTSYPASQNGGTTSYSGTVSETVTVEINVDTNRFDNSVRVCNANVDGLTLAVAATEAAQVASIRKNAEKVGTTIVNGFFKTIQSEISQQLSELTSRIEATFIHMKKMSERCNEKLLQMQSDYHQLTERYGKIFQELNKELENRVFELDKPTFIFKRDCDAINDRAFCGDFATTAIVSNKENCNLDATLGVSHVKNTAYEAIQKANTFLLKQKHTENVLKNSILSESQDAFYYAPVCYFETKEGEIINKKTFVPQDLQTINNQELIAKVEDKNYDKSEEMKQISVNFNNEVSAYYNTSNSHDNRVRDYITQLFNNYSETI